MRRIIHQFVDYIPEKLCEGVLYVSMTYGTVSHLCCCGCGREVVTPLTPTDWELTYDGETISLSPSIGNWGFPCRSHYWIRKGMVKWAGAWSEDKVNSAHAEDQRRKTRYYKGRADSAEAAISHTDTPRQPRFWQLLWNNISGRK